MADESTEGERPTRRGGGRSHRPRRARDALEPTTGAHAATAFPTASTSGSTSHRRPVPEMPDDEVAVAIDDVAVNPGSVVGGGPTTTSVEVITPALPAPATAARTAATRRRTAPCSPQTPRSTVASASAPTPAATSRWSTRPTTSRPPRCPSRRSRSRPIASSTSTARPVPHRTAGSTGSSTRPRCIWSTSAIPRRSARTRR